MDRAVRAGRFFHRVELLNVVRNNNAGDATADLRDAHRAIDEMPHLLRIGHHVHKFVRDIFVQRDEIDFLLVLAAERRARLLSDDRDNRLMIHLRVIEAIQEMDRARAGGRETDADFSGELGMRARHERGHFLVAHLHKLHQVAGAIQRAHDSVNAIAGKSVDAVDAPRGKAFQKKIANLIAHIFFRFSVLNRCLQTRWL
jgi:hypothetical protein